MKRMDAIPYLALVFVLLGGLFTWYVTFDYRKKNHQLSEQIRDIHTGGDSFLDVEVNRNKASGTLRLTGFVRGKYAMRDVKMWFIYHPDNDTINKDFTLSKQLTAPIELRGNHTKYILGTVRTERTLSDFPIGSFELSTNYTLEIYVEAANFVSFQWIAYDGVNNKIWSDIIINEGPRERERLREPRDNGFPKNEKGYPQLNWRNP